MTASSSEKFYVENRSKWNPYAETNYALDEESSARTLVGGIILPARVKSGKFIYEGGVCDRDLNFVAGSKRKFINIESAYPIERSEIVNVDEDVIYGGVVVSHFGHFINEHWTRLWYVVQHPELKLRVAILLSGSGKKDWHDGLFELMGISSERLLYVDKPMQFRSVTVPDDALIGYFRYTRNYPATFEYVREHVEPANVKKLYLSHIAFNAAKPKGTHVFGEQYFRDFFAARGYTVVEPEKLPVREQIALFAGADEVVSLLGTLSHLALFCRPGTKFIMLERAEKPAEPIALQCTVNQISGVDWYIVNVARNFMYANRLSGVCMVGVTEQWRRFVEDYFGERIELYDDAEHIDSAIDEYVQYWCKTYSKGAHLPDSLRQMCTRTVGLEKRLGLGRPMLYCSVHVARKGWLPSASEAKVNGVLDKALDIQALKIYFEPKYCDVYYAVWYPKGGWTAEVSTGKQAGTTGRSRPIYGIKIRLDEEGARKYSIMYRVHDFDGKWSEWSSDGGEIRSEGVCLNALCIKLIER